MKTTSARTVTKLNMGIQRFTELYRGKDESRLPYAIALTWIAGGLILAKAAEVTGLTDLLVDSVNAGADFVGQQVDAAVDTVGGVVYDAVADNGPPGGEYPRPGLIPNPDTLGYSRITPLLDSVELS